MDSQRIFLYLLKEKVYNIRKSAQKQSGKLSKYVHTQQKQVKNVNIEVKIFTSQNVHNFAK